MKNILLKIEGYNIELIYVGPCHQVGDTIVYFSQEKVVFAGDVVFQNSIPVGWVGSYKNWFKAFRLYHLFKSRCCSARPRTCL